MIPSLQIVKSTVGCDPALSVLVRVKNEHRALPEFWSRLSAQTIFSRTEVLFLDSGSTDGTLEFLQPLPVSIYQMRPEEFCFGATCNLLVSLSRAPVVCFVSGHVLLETRDALEKLHAALSGSVRAAAYLRQVPDTLFGANYYERAYLRRRYPCHRDLELIEMHRPAGFSNAASGLTRDAWEDNPFPEIPASEDFVWAEKHLALGGKLFYLPGVTVMHSHRDLASTVYQRVRLNAQARGEKGSYLRASYFLVGVLLAMLRMGAPPNEALLYAVSHARAYLPHNLRTPQIPSRALTPGPHKASDVNRGAA